MARFTILETQAVWVTWTYEIEADSKEEARQKYQDQQPTSDCEPIIGDTINGYEQIIEVTE